MGYLDHIRACNDWDPAGFAPFEADAERVGWVRPAFAERLSDWPDVFRCGEQGLAFAPDMVGFERRTAAVARVLRTLSEEGEIPALHGELYPVGSDRLQPSFLIDREAAAWFGVRAYGQHINGFVRKGGGLHMWIGKRAADKRNFPGKLDHLAAGGLPHGIGLLDNLVKECWEEAGIPLQLSRAARSAGALTYCRETRAGLKSDTIYCYDLELPEDFVPYATDGEMESFRLLPLDEVQALVRDGEEFKPNCNLVVIDFLIRHGRLGPDAEGFLDIVQGLHPELP